MNFLSIVSIFILLIFNYSSIDCFFIPNPLNWFRRTTTIELPEPQTISTVSSLESTNNNNNSDPTTTQSIDELFQTPINQIRPNELSVPLPTNRPFAAPDRATDPLTLSMLGIPVKKDRFGLEPLPYPLKASHPQITFANDPTLMREKTKLLRRFGDLQELTTTTTQLPSMDEIKELVQEQFSSTQEYYSTIAPTDSPTTDIELDPEQLEHINEDNEYIMTESDLLSETNESDDYSSPTPVYRSTTPSPDTTTVAYTTPEPTYLHNEEFANMLNNMYYNKPEEMFESMMDKFNRSHRSIS